MIWRVGFDNRLSNFKMLQDVESLTNSEMSIADNMIKVGYVVISADQMIVL